MTFLGTEAVESVLWDQKEHADVYSGDAYPAVLKRWTERTLERKRQMLGWMILFVLGFVLGLVAALKGNFMHASMWITSSLSGCLFLVALLTRAVRRWTQ